MKSENPVDAVFLNNLCGGITLLNHVCIERIGSLLHAAKGEHEKLKGGHASFDAIEKELMMRSLREMSERYLEFGPVGLLNELELAKTARMLDTVITTIQYYLINEQGFSEMFQTSLDLYLMRLEEYREYIANRMMYFLEIRQETLHVKTEDFGFGDLCRSWLVLDRAPPDEKNRASVWQSGCQNALVGLWCVFES